MERLQPLTFTELDGLAFAAERGRLTISSEHCWEIHDLGPFVEYLFLAQSGLLPFPEDISWLALNGGADIYKAMQNRRHSWVCPKSRYVGFHRTYQQHLADETSWTAFCVAAQYAATEVGFPKLLAGQLVGALGEMESNIYEHSHNPATGLIAFKATPGEFQFVVADLGMGVLQSLRSCPNYADLSDHGEALRLTLTDGISRHGPGQDRGHGFRPLFTGLANLNGMLRFRSGDHALTINGQNPVNIPAKLAKKPPLRGLFISVSCFS